MGVRPPIHRPIVTAGLKCPPVICPNSAERCLGSAFGHSALVERAWNQASSYELRLLGFSELLVEDGGIGSLEVCYGY